MEDMAKQLTVTLPFFRDQVNFKQKNLREKAKYMLFFVTEVVRLRRDGMEPSIIVERLVDQGVGLQDLTIDQAIADITTYFDDCVKEGELKYHRRGENPNAAYGFIGERTDRYLKELRRGVEVFISYAGRFEGRAIRVAELLSNIGVTPWLAIKHGGVIEDNIIKAINVRACAVAFLISPDFHSREFLGAEIDLALQKFEKTTRERFQIIPIMVLDHAETPDPRLIEKRVPQPLRDAKIACHWAKDDADIVNHILTFMPLRLSVAGWKSE